jgi:hypothetical protein
MTPKFKSLAALATIAVLAPAAGAVAQDATTTPSLKVKGAYAYVENNLGDKKDYIAVVFKTANVLPRRFDGMLRAGGALDGTGHSIGSVKGKNSKCYTFYVRVLDGKIHGKDGKVSAKRGTTHELTVSARGTEGDLTASKQVTIRAKRAGDSAGKPLAC